MKQVLLRTIKRVQASPDSKTVAVGGRKVKIVMHKLPSKKRTSKKSAKVVSKSVLQSVRAKKTIAKKRSHRRRR